jgi:hypothetical protein
MLGETCLSARSDHRRHSEVHSGHCQGGDHHVRSFERQLIRREHLAIGPGRIEDDSAKSFYDFTMRCRLALSVERNETLEEPNFPTWSAVMERTQKIHGCCHHNAAPARVPVAMLLLQPLEYSPSWIPSLVERHRKRSFNQEIQNTLLGVFVASATRLP